MMMKGQHLSYALKVAVTLIFSGILSNAIQAQPGHGPGRGPVAQNCADEITKLCAGKKHGHGEIRGCLEAHKSQVSDKCKHALDTTGWGRKHHQQ